jgi:hypothetical protein
MTVLPSPAEWSFFIPSKEAKLMYQPSPELEQLRAKQARGHKQLEQLRHREQQLQNRIRYLEGADRRQRNHRLITRGAAVEHAYKEQSSYSTIDFVQRAIIYYGLTVP